MQSAADAHREKAKRINIHLYIKLKNYEKEQQSMEVIKLREEYIKLGQALKAAGLAESGVDAKFAIQDGLVKVNGAVELQRGKKLYDGDLVEFQGNTIKIEK